MTNNLETSAEASIAKNRTLVERIQMYVPFYRGYKQKNLRRDEDRAIRDVVTKVLQAAKTDLANAARATLGDLDAMRDLERIRSKVDRYQTDVKKAVGGYSGVRESVKVLESELDRVISWDAHLIEDVELLKEQTQQMVSDMDQGLSIKSDMRTIEQTIDDLINTFRERDNIMKNLVEE
ncbi:MAG: hypothetical protein MJZ38_04500 [archaeon]|nr:hypothetical protein [archaeon]